MRRRGNHFLGNGFWLLQRFVMEPQVQSFPRQFPLGFESAAMVAPGERSVITNRPRVKFRGERLLVEDRVGESFWILDLLVGDKRQAFVKDGPVAASRFNPTSPMHRVELDEAQINEPVTFVVENRGSEPRVFRLAIMGTVTL